MKAAIILFIIQIPSLVAAGISVELGPAGRIVFPYSNPPVVIQTSENFNEIFSPDDPVALVGAAVKIHLIPSLPFEVSGLFGKYDPYFEYSEEYADTTVAEFRSGALTLVTLGFQKNLGEIVLLAGSEIYIYHETWMEFDGSGWGGYHKEASNTIIGPYAGAGIKMPFSALVFDFDIRLHFPDLTDRWLSAGCSILFD